MTPDSLFYIIMKAIICVAFLCIYGIAWGQKYDNNWQVCFSTDTYPPVEYHFLNFDSVFPSLIEYFSPIQYLRANLVMSDHSGNMIFYSNGLQIADASHSIMENGDTINIGIGWHDHGSPFVYNIFSVPDINHDNIYYIIHCNYDTTDLVNDIVIKDLLYTVVDMNLVNGLGAVVTRNNPFLSDIGLAFPNAVKHGNGRDWWIVTPKYYESKYYVQLFGPEGISPPSMQEIGYKPDSPTDFIGNKLFSPDGSKYLDYDSRNGIRLFDFDRCAGLLSNPVNCDVPFEEHWGGAAFSPNSRFLYINEGAYVLQYDLQAPDICASIDTIIIATDILQVRVPVLGPDGKIYIQAKQTSNKLHIIHHPDLKGDLCQLELDAIDIPCYNIDNIPLFPNYRLYDIPGSPCDTLGINDPNVGTYTPSGYAVKMTVFPNPVSDMLYAKVEGTKGSSVAFRICDMRGRILSAGIAPLLQGNISISFKDLPDGLYMLTLEEAGEWQVTEKVVIIK